jgi:putative endonuclease
VERNYRCREGEIDIIARRRGLTAFCEVRARSADPLVAPEETVDGAKRRKLTLAARRYLQGLQEKGEDPGSCRFDVVSVIMEGGRMRIDHIEDAFAEVD